MMAALTASTMGVLPGRTVVSLRGRSRPSLSGLSGRAGLGFHVRRQLAVTVNAGDKPSVVPLPKLPGLSSDDGLPAITEREREAGRDLSKNFDYDLWGKHRSAGRYARHTVTLLQSRVLLHLRWPIFCMSLFAAAVCGVYTAFPSLPPVPLAPVTLTASLLGLLLVFRTNSSYGRFHEARCLWGSIVNRTRDMNRQTTTWWPTATGAESARMIALFQRWTVAMVRSLKIHLRSRGDLDKELAHILPAYELAALKASDHRPNYAVQVLSEAISQSGMPTEKIARMDRNLTAMADAIGACERILRTPIPVSYTRHTTRLLTLWLLLLPMGLHASCGWATVPITAVVSFMMLGIEEIGVSIEEPFSVLALDAIANTIETNTLEIAETHGVRGTEDLSADELVRASLSISDDEVKSLEDAYAK